jgi:hypothetical protein
MGLSWLIRLFHNLRKDDLNSVYPPVGDPTSRLL